MSKRLNDLNTPTNRYLFDMLFRHQVYLEGVKSGFAINYKEMLKLLYDEFAKYIGQTRYNTLDGFTKVELREFIRRFELAQQSFYSRYTKQLIELLKQFLAADVEVTQAIYTAVSGMTIDERSKAPQPDDNSATLGLGAVHGTGEANDLLWASITNAIIPANGMTIAQMLDSFGQTTEERVKRTLLMGYANGDKPRDALSAIVGEPTLRFRDGLFNTFNNQNIALIATAMQHISSIAQAAIASVYYNDYQWVSIMDGKTTPICISRNGNVYAYGEGPLPPAHYGCRSKAVSLTDGSEIHDVPETFPLWLVTQPSELLADMFGAAVATSIVSSSKSLKDISISNSVIPLTLTQYRKKISLITMSPIDGTDN